MRASSSVRCSSSCATTRSNSALPRSTSRSRWCWCACAPCGGRDRGDERRDRHDGGDDGDDGRGGHRVIVGAPRRAATPSATSAHASRRSERSSGSIPSVVASCRRAWRTGVDSARCARLVANANAGRGKRLEPQRLRLDEIARSGPGTRPRASAKPNFVWKRELEVVGGHRDRPDRDEHEQPEAPGVARRRSRSPPPRPARPPRARRAPARDRRPERTVLQLVKCVRGDAHRQEERQQRPEQPVEVKVRRERRAERHIGQVPEPCTAGGAASRSRASRHGGARRTRALRLFLRPHVTTPPPRLSRRVATSRCRPRATPRALGSGQRA